MFSVDRDQVVQLFVCCRIQIEGSADILPVRAIANERAPFVKVTGDVSYSTINAKDAAKYYQGEIVFNNEEDNHEPLLTVAQTLDKALVSIGQLILNL